MTQSLIFVYLFAIYTNFTTFTNWCESDIIDVMKRATVTLPDDLAEAVEMYTQAQDVPPALTAVVQAALREYLRGTRIFADLPAVET